MSPTLEALRVRAQATQSPRSAFPLLSGLLVVLPAIVVHLRDPLSTCRARCEPLGQFQTAHLALHSVFRQRPSRAASPDNSMLPYRVLIARSRSHLAVRARAHSSSLVTMPPSKRKIANKSNGEQAGHVKAARARQAAESSAGTSACATTPCALRHDRLAPSDGPIAYSPLLLRDNRALALELQRPQVTAETIGPTSSEAAHSERDQAQRLEEAIKAFFGSEHTDDAERSSSSSVTVLLGMTFKGIKRCSEPTY